MLNEFSIDQLLNELSSENPSLGGGTVSGLSGALSAALISMVCHLSIGKKDYRQSEDELKRNLENVDKLRGEFLLLAEKDSEVYNEVLNAYSLPQETEDQKQERKKSIQEATKKAALIPMDIIHRCEKLVNLSLSAASKGNENSVSDAGIAGIMAYAAAQSAALNILLNLSTITDEDFRGKVKTEQDKVLKNIKNSYDEIIQIVSSKL
jgi:glutamate formiminotransferase/formiminotetrahydrofolate cyclodeaminase